MATRRENRAARQAQASAPLSRQEARQQRAEGGKQAKGTRKENRAARLAETKAMESQNRQVQNIVGQASEFNDNLVRQQNRVNNIAETGPYGSSSYTYDEQGNITGRNINLDAAQQRTLDLQNQQSQNALNLSQNAMGQLGQAPALNFNNLQGAQARFTEMPTDATRQRVEQATFDRGANLLNKQFSNMAAEETANLRARGYQFGGQDYNKLYNERVNDPRTQAMNDLAQRSVEAGGVEQQRMNQMQLGTNAQNFGQSMQSRQQGINEQVLQRNQPLQEAQALNSLNYGVQNPTFNPYQAAQNQGVDVGGLNMGFAGMANDRSMQQNQFRQDQWMMRNTPRGGGGGAMSFDDWAQRQAYGAYLQQQNMSHQAALQNGMTQGQEGPSVWGQVGAGIAQGVGQGLGQWAAGGF